jgi:hypothetical protein
MEGQILDDVRTRQSCPASDRAALLHARFDSTQLRILLWIIRHTYGWNRSSTPFTWYRIAVDLKANRGTVFRAGVRLLQSQVLRSAAGRIGIQPEFVSWDRAIADAAGAVAREQRWTTHKATFKKQRKPLPGSNGTVATEQRFSVERKTGVKTELQRRRRGGHVHNRAAENDSTRELINFYGALTGDARSAKQATTSTNASASLQGPSSMPAPAIWKKPQLSCKSRWPEDLIHDGPSVFWTLRFLRCPFSAPLLAGTARWGAFLRAGRHCGLLLRLLLRCAFMALPKIEKRDFGPLQKAALGRASKGPTRPWVPRQERSRKEEQHV